MPKDWSAFTSTQLCFWSCVSSSLSLLSDCFEWSTNLKTNPWHYILPGFQAPIPNPDSWSWLVAECQFWSSQRPFHHHDEGIALGWHLGLVMWHLDEVSPIHQNLLRIRWTWHLTQIFVETEKNALYNQGTCFQLFIQSSGIYSWPNKKTEENSPCQNCVPLATIQTQTKQDGQWSNGTTALAVCSWKISICKPSRDTWLWNCCKAGRCPTETYPASLSSALWHDMMMIGETWINKWYSILVILTWCLSHIAWIYCIPRCKTTSTIFNDQMHWVNTNNICEYYK